VDRGSLAQTMTFDPGDWRPRYWTLACVSTFHLILAATLITATPKLPEPTVFNAVDVVTFPDGTTSNPDPSIPPEPVTLTPPETAQPKSTTPISLPQVRVDPRFGPRPTDKRVLPEPEPPRPIPVPVPVPVPVAKLAPLTPAPQASPAPRTEVVPKAVPTPAPAPVPEAVQQPVSPRQNAPTPTLIQPPPNPLSIRADKLKINQNPALKPVQTRVIPLPAPPALPKPVVAPGLPKQVAAPTPAPAQPAPPVVVRTPSPPPPAFVGAAPAPLTPARDTRALPKVQVPRVRATDLRLPEVQAAGAGASAPAGSATPAGVTSLTPNRPVVAGGGGSSGSGEGGSGATGGSGGSGGTAGGSGAAGGAPSASGGQSGGGGGGGPSGILPRRPGGASVREAFPRSNSTLLGKMDTTFDCSRIGRDRDARCPEWTPMDGRNGKGAATYEVPVPKGITPPRYATGTNPLPPCPPGTPGNQMGLSCLPSREGPGIPRP
jgi:hypothetical protein